MAVCAVHTFHKHPITVKGSYYDPSQYPVTNFILDFVEKFVADFSVPTFFFHGFGRRVHATYIGILAALTGLYLLIGKMSPLMLRILTGRS